MRRSLGPAVGDGPAALIDRGRAGFTGRPCLDPATPRPVPARPRAAMRGTGGDAVVFEDDMTGWGIFWTGSAAASRWSSRGLHVAATDGGATLLPWWRSSSGWWTPSPTPSPDSLIGARETLRGYSWLTLVPAALVTGGGAAAGDRALP
ncbi:hypothetical protein [Actinoplanes sp. NPDC051494]|uniref:hypothetical protein n=1 Tax=Actinoplanes sp. NPDC051494 TaxID=3363907 RepID=UPI0037969657